MPRATAPSNLFCSTRAAVRLVRPAEFIHGPVTTLPEMTTPVPLTTLIPPCTRPTDGAVAMIVLSWTCTESTGSRTTVLVGSVEAWICNPVNEPGDVKWLLLMTDREAPIKKAHVPGPQVTVLFVYRTRVAMPVIPLSLVAVIGPSCAALASRTNRDRKSTRLNSSHPSISYAV